MRRAAAAVSTSCRCRGRGRAGSARESARIKRPAVAVGVWRRPGPAPVPRPGDRGSRGVVPPARAGACRPVQGRFRFRLAFGRCACRELRHAMPAMLRGLCLRSWRATGMRDGSMAVAAMTETSRALLRGTGAALSRMFGAGGTSESRCPRGLTSGAGMSDSGIIISRKPQARPASARHERACMAAVAGPSVLPA